MSEGNGNKPRFLCRVIGHKWDCSHTVRKLADGTFAWAYIDHCCTRCWTTENRFPDPVEMPGSKP